MKSENLTTPSSPGALKSWLLAARPRTWIASVSPVVMGTVLAPSVDIFLFLLTLSFALLIQIGTNFANDAFDFLKGADTALRVGPKRATQQGWISAKEMLFAAGGIFFAAVLVALPLMLRAGWWSFPLAALCILFGIAYTGGPKPLGYLGFGEVLVLVFFGPLAVGGTYFLQTSSWSMPVLIAGLAPGLLSCALLIANNLRDETSDRAAGKRTLVVRWGTGFGRWEYVASIALAALIPLVLVFVYHAPKSLLFASLLLPLSYRSIQTVFSFSKPVEIVPVLQRTALLFYVYTMLFCLGWYWTLSISCGVLFGGSSAALISLVLFLYFYNAADHSKIKSDGYRLGDALENPLRIKCPKSSVKLFQYQFAQRKGLILQCDDGWGEIAPLPGFSKETLEEAKEEILSLLPHLSSAKPQCPSVQFGIASAMRPLRAIKVSLCALNTPKAGCSTLKLKVGHLSPDSAVSLVRSYLGHYHLRIDCNRMWSLEQALSFASHFSPSDFDYLEEPVQTPEELLRFSEITQFPIALDETYRDVGPLQIPTLKAIVIKPMLSGSLPSFPHLVLSSSYETSLGHLRIAELASPDSLPLGLDTFSNDLLNPPLRIEKGFLVWEPSRVPIRTDLLCAL